MAELDFCVECGADKAVGAQRCSACGVTLGDDPAQAPNIAPALPAPAFTASSVPIAAVRPSSAAPPSTTAMLGPAAPGMSPAAAATDPSPIHACLKHYFGHTAFRKGQLEATQAILDGRDALCVFATGSGKSLLYQLPPLLGRPGVSRDVALVVSPLKALMEDQARALVARGIPVVNLASDAAPTGYTMEQARIVFITPEKAAGGQHRAWMSDMANRGRLALVAIDEAHCCSEWGHDFRPEYRLLGQLRHYCPRVPFLAVTATATDAVRRDIIKTLSLASPHVDVQSFDRPNLHYSIVTPSKYQSTDLSRVLHEAARAMGRDGPGPTILYVNARKEAERIAAVINALPDPTLDDGRVAPPPAFYAGAGGWGLGASAAAAGAAPAQTNQLPLEPRVHSGVMYGRAAAFHADMPEEYKRAAGRGFSIGSVGFVVATIAFGMGIDKKDVRMVVHMQPPHTLEMYQQQVGRAGRDGEPSRCVMFYQPSDISSLRGFIAADQGRAAAASRAGAGATALASGRQSYGSSGGGSSDGGEKPDPFAMLNKVQAYCEGSSCRRRHLLAHFLETLPDDARSASCCDICDSIKDGTRGAVKDFTGYIRLFLTAVSVTQQYHLASGIVPDVVRGSVPEDKRSRISGHTQYQAVYGKGKDMSKDFWQAIGSMASGMGYTASDNRSFSTGGRSIAFVVLSLTPQGREVVEKPGLTIPPMSVPPHMARFFADKRTSGASTASASGGASGAAAGSAGASARGPGAAVRAGAAAAAAGVALLSAQEQLLFSHLSQLTSTLASAQTISAYNILPAVALKALALARPKDEQALRAVEGISALFVNKYGQKYLSEIATMCQQLKLELKGATEPAWESARTSGVEGHMTGRTAGGAAAGALGSSASSPAAASASTASSQWDDGDVTAVRSAASVAPSRPMTTISPRAPSLCPEARGLPLMTTAADTPQGSKEADAWQQIVVVGGKSVARFAAERPRPTKAEPNKVGIAESTVISYIHGAISAGMLALTVPACYGFDAVAAMGSAAGRVVARAGVQGRLATVGPGASSSAQAPGTLPAPQLEAQVRQLVSQTAFSSAVDHVLGRMACAAADVGNMCTALQQYALALTGKRLPWLPWPTGVPNTVGQPNPVLSDSEADSFFKGAYNSPDTTAVGEPFPMAPIMKLAEPMLQQGKLADDGTPTLDKPWGVLKMVVALAACRQEFLQAFPLLHLKGTGSHADASSAAAPSAQQLGMARMFGSAAMAGSSAAVNTLETRLSEAVTAAVSEWRAGSGAAAVGAGASSAAGVSMASAVHAGTKRLRNDDEDPADEVGGAGIDYEGTHGAGSGAGGGSALGHGVFGHALPGHQQQGAGPAMPAEDEDYDYL